MCSFLQPEEVLKSSLWLATNGDASERPGRNRQVKTSMSTSKTIRASETQKVISFWGQSNLLIDGDDSCIPVQNLSFPKMMHFCLSLALWNSTGSWFRFPELFCLVPSMPLAINRVKINNSNVICFNNVQLCKTSLWHAHLCVGRERKLMTYWVLL